MNKIVYVFAGGAVVGAGVFDSVLINTDREQESKKVLAEKKDIL